MKTISTKINVLPDESWWGGLINTPYQMPFPNGAKVELRNLLGNCGNPLLLSDKGRYIWSDEPFMFELKDNSLILTSDSDLAKFEIDESSSNLREAYLRACQNHFPPNGEIPGELFFTAPQYNTWIEMTYYATQTRVLEYAEKLLEHGFPPGVLMIDTLWHPTYGTWAFDEARFPDPKGMIRKLNEMGFKVMLWVVPYVTADTLTFRFLRDKDYLLKKDDGQIMLVEWWDGYSAALDLTKVEAIDWLYTRLDFLVNEFGVSGFKFDGGHPEGYAGIIRPHEITTAWNKVGLRYEYSEYKDSWKSAGLPLAQRIRDRFHTWDDRNGLGSLVTMGIQQGLLGYIFNCPDMVGGGDYQVFPPAGIDEFDPELFVRSAQASALFPMMQFSAAPWRLLGKEELDYCIQAAQLHSQMGIEILELARHSAQTGEPLMRSLEYEFPGMGYKNINDQFLLGSDILVAPVTVKGATSRTVVFPPGKWMDELGKIVTGGQTTLVNAPLNHLPWYRKIE